MVWGRAKTRTLLNLRGTDFSDYLYDGKHVTFLETIQYSDAKEKFLQKLEHNPMSNSKEQAAVTNHADTTIFYLCLSLIGRSD